MHIPAMDSLRHERVGIISARDGAVTMLTQAYVQTEATEERGAEDPIEGMARPFPYMVNAQEAVAVEPIIENGELEELSDALVEYTALLYESVMAEEWVDELEEFDSASLTGSDELLAASLMHFTTRERPQTLWRAVYEQAHRLMEDDEVSEIMDNPLEDIEGRERYGFNYLPSKDEVDDWKLTISEVEQEAEDGTPMVADSLWLRYKYGDTEEERPLLVYQNEAAGFSASSPSVDFGSEEMDEVEAELIEAILSGDESYDSNLASVSMDELEGTRTLEYLKAY